MSPVDCVEIVGPQGPRGFPKHVAIHSRWLVPSVEGARRWNTTRERDKIDPYLLLGVVGAIVPTVVRVSGPKHAFNYGLDDVRFEAPLALGDRVSVELGSVDGPGRWLDARWVVWAAGPVVGRAVLSAVLTVRYFFEERC